ncbi:hypothetical protein EDF60_2142 [Leucobacter luti]|nr:hypothetical protein [Leucobacter luti]TCK41708.1 hypothetical protein EDF60_2142 [Leucobacter luti]
MNSVSGLCTSAGDSFASILLSGSDTTCTAHPSTVESSERATGAPPSARCVDHSDDRTAGSRIPRARPPAANGLARHDPVVGIVAACALGHAELETKKREALEEREVPTPRRGGRNFRAVQSPRPSITAASPAELRRSAGPATALLFLPL